ncbi:MAG: deoxyribonuclease IV [Candidatus Krumholzibacteriota bacterium]|nr:deoxyribonuclease IV [Candidatus Krumholzibacteriota bacterium]
MNLGAHMSIAGGVHLALRRGLEIGCNAVQLFVKSSNQWKAKKLTEGEISLFHEEMINFQPTYIMAHCSYLINIASPEPVLLQKSKEALLVEMQRSEILQIPYLVLHPGSHKGAGEEAGAETVARSLDEVFAKTEGDNLMILLENTSGQGNYLGHSFEQLARMREMVEEKSRVGFCFDTCHGFAAGYDLTSRRAYEETFRAFDRALSLENLKAFHLNDSKTGLGSRKDRHTHIGKGELGLEPFRLLVNDPRFEKIPMVLETPKGPDLKEDIENLSVLRGLRAKIAAGRRAPSG